MSDVVITLFPEPLSPTIARRSPGWRSKDTPSTARTIPRRVAKWVRSPSTARSGLGATDCMSALRSRVERLPQAIREEVEAHGGEHDRDARGRADPPGLLQETPSLADDVAPRCLRRHDAQTEEAQCCLGEDGVRRVGAGDHEHGGDGVRENVAENDVPGGRGDHPRGVDETARFDPKRERALQANGAG